MDSTDRTVSPAVRPVAARVANELSQPVTHLALALEIMLAGAAHRGRKTVQVDELQALYRSVRRLIHLIDALRCCAGDGSTRSRPALLNEVVSRASAGTADVELALDAGDPLVLTDAAALERLVRRVLTDACRIAGDARRVRIETAAAPGAPDQVVLVIQGVGEVTGLADSSRPLLAEHSGAVGVRSIDDRLVLTFPRLTLHLPGLTHADARPPPAADARAGTGRAG
jgi:K+-sensing histidine kinase KdpD